VAEVYARIAAQGDDRVWIHLVPRSEAQQAARSLADPSLPLYGIPFAVKDNIDVAGVPTTAACPTYAYTPARSASAVERLIGAGAILIGKTNMDQFATGLVGTRSPYGVARNPFSSGHIPGGSSSGSAVAVSAGLVSFALGTDTAGSGRVPAAFNNVVGLKPTRGFFSTRGVVPACRTLDCLSILTLTCDDAERVARIIAAYDPEDPLSRLDARESAFRIRNTASFHFGIPEREALRFFEDPDTPALYERAIDDLKQLGGIEVTIDFAPLREAAGLLYRGPWVAERLAALQGFVDGHAAEMHPVTRGIIEDAKRFSAVDVFTAAYRLAELKRQTDCMWDTVDVLLLPTAGTCFTVEAVMAEPLQRNTDLGYYTNFVNLLDLCATAVPSGFTGGGLPFGVTLAGPAARDGYVLGLADRLHRIRPAPMGAGRTPVPVCRATNESVVLAVIGAHLRGLPLNPQLVDHDALFVRESRTAPAYRLYELPCSVPGKPGLVRVSEGGASIDVELWQMPLDCFGQFAAAIPAPLSMGTVLLQTGEAVKGFLCESAAVENARDISTYGGWRSFQRSQRRTTLASG